MILQMVAGKAFAGLPVSDIAKPVIGGVAFGLIAVVVPLTAFAGSERVRMMLTEGQTMGLALLLAILLGKMLAFALSVGSGFIGGPISGTSSSVARPASSSTRSCRTCPLWGWPSPACSRRCRAGSSKHLSLVLLAALPDAGRDAPDRPHPDRRGAGRLDRLGRAHDRGRAGRGEAGVCQPVSVTTATCARALPPPQDHLIQARPNRRGPVPLRQARWSGVNWMYPRPNGSRRRPARARSTGMMEVKRWW